MTTDSEDKQQSEPDCTFVVDTGRELMEKYGLTDENRPLIKLDSRNVPTDLHPLIPFAERWGETDDYIRGNALERASPELLRDLVQTVHPYAESLRRWLFAEYERVRLGGTETNEQAAFLGLEMHAIESQVKLRVKYGEAHEL